MERGIHMQDKSLFKKVGVYTYLYTGPKDLEEVMGVVAIFSDMYAHPDMGYALYEVTVDREDILLTVYPTEG